MTNEEKNKIYLRYQRMINEYEKALLQGNLKAAELIKCHILLMLSHLLEMVKN